MLFHHSHRWNKGRVFCKNFSQIQNIIIKKLKLFVHADPEKETAAIKHASRKMVKMFTIFGFQTEVHARLYSLSSPPSDIDFMPITGRCPLTNCFFNFFASRRRASRRSYSSSTCCSTCSSSLYFERKQISFNLLRKFII